MSQQGGALMHAVIAGRWEWLKVGAGWGVLLGGVGWLGLEAVWAGVVGAALGVALGRLLVTRETLTLEPDALVNRARGRTVRIPLASIRRITREFVPNTDHYLRVEGARADLVIVVPPVPQVKAVCLELGRRLEHRRTHIRVEKGAAAWLGWSPPVDLALADRRHPVRVVVGAAHLDATYAAVLDVLGDRVIQAVVGARTVAREDADGWSAVVLEAPSPEEVRLLSGRGATLAVFSPASGVVDAMLTDAEEATLAVVLPEGASLVSTANAAWGPALGRVTGWLRRLVRRSPGAGAITRAGRQRP